MATLHDAQKSDYSTSIATISGGKAHLVTTRTLLEDAEVEVLSYNGRPTGRMKTISAGETLYYHTACGTQRNAKWGAKYREMWAPADKVTCVKCAAKAPVAEVVEAEEAPVEEPAAEVTMKVCGKWTRFYANGVEVGRILNGNEGAVFANLKGLLG